jgi:hypothetical protein
VRLGQLSWAWSRVRFEDSERIRQRTRTRPDSITTRIKITARITTQIMAASRGTVTTWIAAGRTRHDPPETRFTARHGVVIRVGGGSEHGSWHDSPDPGSRLGSDHDSDLGSAAVGGRSLIRVMAWITVRLDHGLQVDDGPDHVLTRNRDPGRHALGSGTVPRLGSRCKSWPGLGSRPGSRF